MGRSSRARDRQVPEEDREVALGEVELLRLLQVVLLMLALVLGQLVQVLALAPRQLVVVVAVVGVAVELVGVVVGVVVQYMARD